MSMEIMKKRIVVVVNKGWECDPVLSVLTNEYIQTEIFPVWPEIIHFPQPAGFYSGEPRAVFNINGISVEIWCISDLLARYDKSPCFQSSSERKMEILPIIFNYSSRSADLVIAVGTAASYPADISNNGSVTIGSRVFLHNAYPKGENRECSNWNEGPFDRILGSSLSEKLFNELMESLYQKNLTAYFLKTPVNPAKNANIYSGYNFVALCSINVTQYSEYEKKDFELLESFRKISTDILMAKSIETTHALIKVAAGIETPFIFVSGIVDRYLHFNDDVPNPPYPQNFVGAHNAGIVIAGLLDSITK